MRNVLARYSEIYTKIIDENDPPPPSPPQKKLFMNDEISQAVMTRTRLQNRVLKKQE